MITQITVRPPHSSNGRTVAEATIERKQRDGRTRCCTYDLDDLSYRRLILAAQAAAGTPYYSLDMSEEDLGWTLHRPSTGLIQLKLKHKAMTRLAFAKEDFYDRDLVEQEIAQLEAEYREFRHAV